jgi:uncharacterized protein YhaN
MKVRSLHVDGYGALADLDCAELSPGLVVVLGPNEAGKSTLRDFVTGMLFGFPNRRNDPHFRAPVRGGRHGGTLTFLDDAGGEWTVERYASPQRSLTVRLPDGRPGDEQDLLRVLGNASSSLFRTVFAIGLDELGTIATTSTDEARELLFASSIFGERRSATRAMRRLSEACGELARPRQGDARANRLARELDEIRAELQAARSEAAGYDARRRDVTRLEADMFARREGIRTLRERQRELDALERCWPVARRAESAATSLAALPPADPAAARFRDVASELKELYAEFSGHQERELRLDQLRRQQSGAASSAMGGLEQLGQEWSERKVRSGLAPELLAEQVRDIRQGLAERDSELAAARAVLERADAELAGRRADGDGSDDEALPDAGTLAARREAVSELRERLAEIDELSASVTAAAAALPSPGPATPSPAWVPAAVGVGVLVLAATAVALAAGRQLGFAGACAAVALLFAVAGIAVALTGRRSARAAAITAVTGGGGDAGADGRADDPEGAESAPGARKAATLARAHRRANQLAESLGLALPPSRVDAERLDIQLRRHHEQRQAADRRRTALGEAERGRAEAERAWRTASLAHSESMTRFGSWKRDHGLDEALDPDGALESLSTVAELRKAFVALDRIGAGIADLEPEVTLFRRRCEVIASRLDLAFEPPGLDGLGAWLEGLLDRWEDLSAIEARRAALMSDVADASADLDRSLGAGPDADRLGDELRAGEIWRWKQELERLTPRLDELTAGDETDVRAHQSATEALSELARSDRIATLEQQRAALEEELDETLHQYLVLGAARALLQETLDRHQRERQPAVIATAAEHFERVTAGRYSGLLADGGPEAIKVLTPSGASLDASSLSRGTLEQLYLCLRLGLAGTFAERGVSLPLVLDDVLVNFDADRAQAVAAELVKTAEHHQIVFMTCHRHLAGLMMSSAEAAAPAAGRVAARAQLVELGRV